MHSNDILFRYAALVGGFRSWFMVNLPFKIDVNKQVIMLSPVAFIYTDSFVFVNTIFVLVMIIFVYIFLRYIDTFHKIYLNKTSLPLLALFCFIFIFTGVCFVIPQFSFLFLTGFGGLLTFITIPFGSWNRTKPLSITQKIFMDQLFIFLRDTGLLDLFSMFYILFSFTPTKKIYYYRLGLVFFLSICSILVSRWYFIHVVLLKGSLSFYEQCVVYFLLFLGVGMVYFRLSLNFSLFLITKSLQTYPNYLSPEILFILDGEEGTPPPLNPPNKPSSKFALVNIQFTRASYRNYYHPSPASVRTLGVCLGVAGCAAALITAVYTVQQAGHAKTQADAALIQAEQAKVQSYHTAREADVAAVEAGLISREEYYRRNPGDRPPAKS